MMLSWIRKQRVPVAAGIVAAALCLLAAVLLPLSWRETLKENGFDLVLAADRLVRRTSERPDARVVVVDIDRPSIEALGAWPWPRDTMARLVEATVAARPAALAIDILFAEIDSRSPAALARRLAAATARADLATLADDLPDGDKRLAAALEKVPSALGFVLDPDQSRPIPSVPIMARGALPLRNLWRAAGAVGPILPLQRAMQGIGALSLPGDADGSVRRVPLLVGAGDAMHPGLALEAVRLGQRASAYLVQANPPALKVGTLAVALSDDGLLRLAPVSAGRRKERTVSAVDLIEGRADAGPLAGAIALIGGSAPELGGLRQTSFDPLMPSVQIQADAIEQIMAGRVPRSFRPANVVEPALLVGMSIVAIAAGAALPPIAGAIATISGIILLSMLSLGMSVYFDRLLDPLAPSSAAALVFVATSVTAYAATRRREALLRRRFEQHLAPAVVQRIVEQPELMKLSGERREVTALFTDIEDFTAMTRRADPERLVAALDEYFEGAAAIIIEHGGMIDKVVGDAIHALFNAPFDLDDHPRRAVDCAIALRAWAADYCGRAAPAALGFGRTRIGIETGPAVVGDIGIRAKLDYTAHGDAINAAARLEAANKELGSTICVGPTAASRCDPALFRPLGSIEIRGREDVSAVFEPWLADAPPAWRESYLAAFGLIATDRAHAAELFERMAVERPHDPVPRRMSERLRAGGNRSATERP